MSQGKTELQRSILLTWYENPNATNSEIAEICDCSASYVSQIKNRFDGYDQMEYMMDRQDEELERMFGGEIFGDSTVGPAVSHPSDDGPTEGPGLAEAWDELPNNPIGHIARLLILLVMLYVVYQVATILFF